MAEIAIRTPNLSVCQWLGAERFNGVITVGAHIERGAILGSFRGFSPDFEFIDVPLVSPVSGVVRYIQNSELRNEGELLVRVSYNESVLEDRHQIGTDVFQLVHQKYSDRMRAGQNAIKDKKESMIGGTIMGILVFGGIGWSLAVEGGLKTLGGLIVWALGVALFVTLKKELAEVRRRVSQFPRESTVKSAWASAVSIHLA